MNIEESNAFYKDVLEILKEAKKSPDDIVDTSALKNKFPIWGDTILDYLHNNGIVYQLMGATWYWDKKNIPVFEANIKRKMQRLFVDQLLPVIELAIPIAIAFIPYIIKIWMK